MLAALGSFASRAILPVAAKIGKLGLNAAKSLGSKLVNHGTQAVTNIAKKALAGQNIVDSAKYQMKQLAQRGKQQVVDHANLLMNNTQQILENPDVRQNSIGQISVRPPPPLLQAPKPKKKKMNKH